MDSGSGENIKEWDEAFKAENLEYNKMQLWESTVVCDGNGIAFKCEQNHL